MDLRAPDRKSLLQRENSMRLPLLLLFATAACTVEGGLEYDPPEGSETIHFDPDTGVLSLNTDIVPVVDDCQGELRVGPDGWVCERPTVGWERIDHRTEVFPPNPHQHRFEDITEVPPSLPPGPHGHPWQELTGLPEAFAPAAHAHGLAEVAISEQDTWPGQATWNAIEGQPGAFPVAGHSHSWDSLSNRPEVFPASAHEHPWQQVLNKPTEFSPSAHGHLLSEVSINEQAVFPGRTAWNRLDGVPYNFPPETHSHSWSELTGKPQTFPANTHTHTWESVPGKPEQFPADEHEHGWEDLVEVPEQFPPESHGHQWTAITGVTSTTSWPGRIPDSRVTDLNPQVRSSFVAAARLGDWSTFGSMEFGNSCGAHCGGLFCCWGSVCNDAACYPLFTDFEAAPGYQPPQVKRVGDNVYLRGVLQKANQTYATDDVLFVLSYGYRPPETLTFLRSTRTSQRLIEIRPDGTVVFVGGSTTAGVTSLSGIVFSTAD